MIAWQNAKTKVVELFQVAEKAEIASAVHGTSDA